MITVVVGGATGKLGTFVCQKILASEDMKLIGGTVSPNGPHVGKEIYPGIIGSSPDDLGKLLEGCDVYVDLTSPAAASKVVADIPNSGANIVLGTTAVDPEVIERMRGNIESCGTSGLISSNFAIGVNVFWKMCEMMAKYLPEYDIEVIEAHHNQKKDAPSGTAMEAVRRLSQASGIDDIVYGREGVTGPRKKEICVHSIRAGDIIGDHTVIFARNNERIELTHKAISREVFAEGCIESIRWLAGRKDGKIHDMNEVLGI